MITMNRGYVREAYVGGKKYALYAVPAALDLKDFKDVEQVDGFAVYAQPAEDSQKFEAAAAGVKFSKLPDEQSWMVFFPLNLLFGGRSKIMDAMDEAARKLRGGISNVNCFYKGCRKQAEFYAEAPHGLAGGGCWYACSKEHFSSVTSKGVSINADSYRRFLKVG